MVNRVAPHFWAVFWNLVVTYGVPPLILGAGAWYQGMLKGQQAAGLHLDPFTSAVASLPSWLVVVVLVGLIVAWALVIARNTVAKRDDTANERIQGSGFRSGLDPANAASHELAAANQRELAANQQRDAAQQQLLSAQKQRDDAQRELAEVKAELAEARKASRALKPLAPREKEARALVPLSPPNAQEKRILVDVTPSAINATFKEHTTVQANKLVAAYLGKWIELSGGFKDLKTYVGKEWLVTFEFKDYPVVMMVFQAEWGGHLEVLARGAPLTVIGRIEHIESDLIRLHDCEIKQ